MAHVDLGPVAIATGRHKCIGGNFICSCTRQAGATGPIAPLSMSIYPQQLIEPLSKGACIPVFSIYINGFPARGLNEKESDVTAPFSVETV